ncbi:MAG: lytic transglycosylase domain-containing protein [Verrucomicrobiota bacterium]
MIRFLFKFILCLVLALLAGAAILATRGGDVTYRVHEWLSPARFHQYDDIIREVAAKDGVDPMLVKALVWRESRFEPGKLGTAGERGLMQVSELAAREWASETHARGFQVAQLFDPKTNLEAGTWYLRRALQHWQRQKAPAAFALAEYNAGPSRAQRWANNNPDTPMTVQDFQNRINFPGTRQYVISVLQRYDFYRHRGRM